MQSILVADNVGDYRRIVKALQGQGLNLVFLGDIADTERWNSSQRFGV